MLSATPVGQVVIDDPKHSITKETVNRTLEDINVGFGITDIISNVAEQHIQSIQILTTD
jgi:hypothetical protein